MSTDAELLSRYVDTRAEAAFADLVRRHLNLVYSAARRQVGGDMHLAEDVAQCVFADLAKKAPVLRHRTSPLSSWLYTSTHFAAAKLVRTERRRKTREQEAHAMNENVSDTRATAAWDQLRPVLDQAMHEMAERDRQAVLLRFFEKLSLAEVGQRLGLSENTATKTVARAINRLRASLAKRGITSTPAALAWLLTEQAVVAAPTGLASTLVASSVGAVTSGTSASLFFQSMVMTKTTMTALSVLVIGAGVAAYQWQANHASRQKEAAAGASVPPITSSSLSKNVVPDKYSRSASESPVAGISQTANGAAAAPKVSKATPPAGSESRATLPRVDNDREVTVRRYSPVYEELGLSAEQSEKMTQLLLDHREAGVDFAAASARYGKDVSGNREAFVGSVFELREKIRDEMRALLGNQAYERFEAEDFAIRQIAVVERLKSGGPEVNAQLTEEQAGRMLNLLRELGVFNLNPEVVQRAAEFLTPTQIEAVERLQQMQRKGPKKEKVLQAIEENRGAGLQPPSK